MKKYIKPAMKVANIESESLLDATSLTVGGDVTGITDKGGETPGSGGGNAKMSGFTSNDLWADDAEGMQ